MRMTESFRYNKTRRGSRVGEIKIPQITPAKKRRAFNSWEMAGNEMADLKSNSLFREKQVAVTLFHEGAKVMALKGKETVRDARRWRAGLPGILNSHKGGCVWGALLPPRTSGQGAEAGCLSAVLICGHCRSWFCGTNLFTSLTPAVFNRPLINNEMGLGWVRVQRNV